MGKVVRFCHLLATTSSKALAGQCYSGLGSPECARRRFSSSLPAEAESSELSDPHGKHQEASIRFDHGLPIVTIPLPSRNELCQFTLRPISDSVGTLCHCLTEEDKGIEFVALYKDGLRISRNTSIQHLLRFQRFQLRINDKYFDMETPADVMNEIDHYEKAQERLESGEKLECLDDLKSKVAALYSILNVDEYKIQREKALLSSLEKVETELQPLEALREKIEEECERYSANVIWVGLVAMGLQTGIFARLTFYEYSWDIIEPVTYFATFSTVMATLGYYIVTKQSFDYPMAQRRMFTKEFYKRAQKHNFDVEHYNALQRLAKELRHDLHRLRDPLYQHLPVDRLAALQSEDAKLRLTNAPKWQRHSEKLSTDSTTSFGSREKVAS